MTQSTPLNSSSPILNRVRMCYLWVEQLSSTNCVSKNFFNSIKYKSRNVLSREFAPYAPWWVVLGSKELKGDEPVGNLMGAHSDTRRNLNILSLSDMKERVTSFWKHTMYVAREQESTLAMLSTCLKINSNRKGLSSDPFTEDLVIMFVYRIIRNHFKFKISN